MAGGVGFARLRGLNAILEVPCKKAEQIMSFLLYR
jgi:hypothetical protein